MNATRLLLAILALALIRPALAPAGASPPGPASPELLKKPYLYEVVRYLYRWYMDEDDVLRARDDRNFTFWVRELRPRLDPGDHSRLAEIILPQLDISVRVKKADYTIPELGLAVKTDRFKITNVSRIKTPKKLPPGAVLVSVDFRNMLDYLFHTRSRAKFPDEALLARLRTAVRKRLQEDARSRGIKLPAGEQIVHISPLSPVANELWVFAETGRHLIRFTSDLDLDNPRVWQHENLGVKLFDIDRQMVLSFDEVAGSNAYLTRDHVGRVLYNCVILGRRLTLPPPEDSGAPGPSGKSGGK